MAAVEIEHSFVRLREALQFSQPLAGLIGELPPPGQDDPFDRRKPDMMLSKTRRQGRETRASTVKRND
jgi:hypothetical protein